MTRKYDRADLEAAYLAGFWASGEGWNGEFPFGRGDCKPTDDGGWLEYRDEKLAAIDARKGGAE